jgi:multiple sugar transport system substrate-binding protein
MDQTTIYEQSPQPQTQFPQREPLPPYEPVGEEGGGGVPKIVKLLLGLIVISIIFFLVFIFIMPRLQTKEEKNELVYWGLFENETIMNNLISDFEKENPEIDVVYQKQDVKQYKEKLVTRIANGTGPDIYRFHNTWVNELSQELLPLPADVMSVGEFKKAFYPVAQVDLIRNGAVFGIPLEVDTLAFYVNSDHYKTQNLTPPTSWTDFINITRALTVKDQNAKILTAGAAMGTYDNINHAPDIISLLLVQNGVDLNDISLQKTRAEDAINFYTSFTLSEGNVWDQTLDSSVLSFSKGTLSSYFGYLRDFFTIKELNQNLLFEIAPVPQLPERKLNIASYWVEGVSTKSRKQKEAFLFLKYLSKKETQDKLYNLQLTERGIGQIPGRTDVGEKLTNDSLTGIFVNQAKDAVSTIFTDSTFDNGTNIQFNAYLKETINSILGGTQAGAALEEFIQKAREDFAPN